MNVFTLIFLPLLFYMFFDFKKAFLIFSFLKILLNQNINLINTHRLPVLTLELTINLGFAAYFFVNIYSHKKLKDFPLKTARPLV